MAARQQCEVDFSDSDFLVSQLGGKARLSQLKKGAGAREAAAVEQREPEEESRVSPWRPLVGKLFVLIPLVLLAWFLLANR